MKKIIFPFLLIFLCISGTVMPQNVRNYAAKFTGTDSYIAVPNHPDLNPAAITIEAWVNPSEIGPTFMGIVSKNNNSYFLGLQGNTGRISFGPKSGAFFQSKFDSRVPVNKWTHIAATYDGSLTAIFINGVLDTVSFAITGFINSNTDSLFIGATSSNLLCFNGMIDNVRIWKSARTISNIIDNMFIPLDPRYSAGQYSQLITSYQLDNSSINTGGSSALSGVPRNVAFVNMNNKVSNYMDYNNSLVLNGTTDYFRYNNIGASFSPTTAITLEAWIRRDTTGVQPPGDQIIIAKNNGGNRVDYKLWIDVNGSLKFKINDPGGPSGLQTFSNLVDNGQWTHVAATYSSVTGMAQLYINGELTADQSITGRPTINDNDDSLFIGGLTITNQKFKGQIDEVRIWRKVRTEQQIRENMYRRLPDTETNCCFFSFDQNVSACRFPAGGSTVSLHLFAGSAHISSSHLHRNNERPSPMLYDEDYYTPTYANSVEKFFIPDNNAVGITDSVYISGTGTVSGLKVYTLISHSFVSDLTLTLTSPSGQSRVLIGNKGGGGNSIMTIFSDEADSSASLTTGEINGPGVTAPFSPGIKPDQSLSSFDGENTEGWWKLKFVDNGAGNTGYVHGWGIQASPLTGIEPVSQTPGRYDLSQNYPNPFNPSTQIRFSIPKAEMVKLAVYDILGKEVRTLINENRAAGTYNVDFNGAGLSSGIYFYRLTAGEFSEVKKMTLIK